MSVFLSNSQGFQSNVHYRVLSNGVGVWVNSSSRWVVSSAFSLAARFVQCGSSARSLAVRLSFRVPAVLRPTFGCSMWVSECWQSCGSGIQVVGRNTLFSFCSVQVFHRESFHSLTWIFEAPKSGAESPCSLSDHLCLARLAP